MKQIFETLYNYDTKGKLRIWYMEQDGNKHRTISGLETGKKVTSGWTVCSPKNTGKANATTAVEQATAEIQALYKKKRDKNWTPVLPLGKEDFEEKYFKPMLAESYKDVTLTFPCFSQPKLDGIRCIANKDGLWTRNGKPFKSVPHIWNAVEPLFDITPNLVLDGELYNHNLRDDFNKICSLVKKTKPTVDDILECASIVEYHVYDYTIIDEDIGFAERHAHLMQVPAPWPLVFVTTNYHENQESLNAAYGSYLEKGYEGQIIRMDTPYENKRTKNLIKRKEFLDEEFEIVSVNEGFGNWSGYAKALTLKLPDGREFNSGIKGNQDYTKQLLKDADKYVGQKATIRFFNYTPDGIPRFPVAVEIGVIDK